MNAHYFPCVDLSVLDLFAGAGGMHSGFKAAGFMWSACIECVLQQKEHCFTTAVQEQENSSKMMLDISLIAVRKKRIKNSLFEFYQVQASLPCQGFSGANQRQGKGQHDLTNNQLTSQFF